MTYSDGKRPASRNKGAASKRPLWEGHRERQRQRMEREGWDTLKPYEMVELVLFHAVPRQDVSDVARLLVDRFGSVGGVFAATREQLLAVEGVTPSIAQWIGLTGELIQAYRDLHNVRDITLSCYREVAAFLEARRGEAAAHDTWVLYADFGFNLITFTELDGDKPWWEDVNARRMMVEAIGNGARYVYIVLWKGGAPLELGGEEESRLEVVAELLHSADILLVDCVLMGDAGMRSMNVNGDLKKLHAGVEFMELHERYVEGAERA